MWLMSIPLCQLTVIQRPPQELEQLARCIALSTFLSKAGDPCQTSPQSCPPGIGRIHKMFVEQGSRVLCLPQRPGSSPDLFSGVGKRIQGRFVVRRCCCGGRHTLPPLQSVRRPLGPSFPASPKAEHPLPGCQMSVPSCWPVWGLSWSPVGGELLASSARSLSSRPATTPQLVGFGGWAAPLRPGPVSALHRTVCHPGYSTARTAGRGLAQPRERAGGRETRRRQRGYTPQTWLASPLVHCPQSQHVPSLSLLLWPGPQHRGPAGSRKSRTATPCGGGSP